MSEMDNLFKTIAEGSSQNPAEATGAATAKDIYELSSEDAERRTKWTNECELLKLCATGPNANEFAIKEMGLTEADSKSKDPDYANKKFPIKVLKDPAVPWDGYQIKTPDGIVEIPKKEALRWLLNKTLGRIEGGTSGTSLRAHRPRSSSVNTKKTAVTVRKNGLYPTNPAHIVKTYEKRTDPTKGPLTENKSVSLEVPEKPNGEKVSVRGFVKDFPVFERMEKFRATLGVIGGRASSTGNNPVHEGLEQEKAIEEWIELTKLARKEGLIK